MEHLDLTGSCWVLRIKKMDEPGGSQIRAFIAVSLPDNAIQILEEIQEKLKFKGIKASWVKPENLHLTLKFLGNVPVQDIDPVFSTMHNVVSDFSKFELSAGGLGVFPGVKKGRVVWAGIGGRTDILKNLFQSLEDHLLLLGIKKERQRFSPHITLGRIKTPVPPAELIPLIQECKDIRSRSFKLGSIDFFKSELTPFGAIHTLLLQAEIKPG